MKNIALSNINHAATLIGGIALYNLVIGLGLAIMSGGVLPPISIEDATNIVTFLSAIIILYKRNFTKIKPTTKKVAKEHNK
jgi:hypothetical protein